MSQSQPQTPSSEANDSQKWGLVILIMAVLLLASFALGGMDTDTSPLPTSMQTLPEATLTEDAPESVNDIDTAEPATLDIPPQPHEVGYTDGIIFFATILVLILLVSTLREVVRRKGV